jgi:hypothetical protein
VQADDAKKIKDDKMTTESIVKIKFDPEHMDRSKANEINMSMEFAAPEGKKSYWCECEVQVRAPLSLSHDAFLEKGKTRVGILGPQKKAIIKQIKLFSSPSMTSNDFLVTVTTFLYDEDATIAERHDTSEVIKCVIPSVTSNKQ